jgi:formiminotetrahydrofolate cyclodeaminase
MNRQISKLQISKFLDDLASKNPTPGGGVVAALSASFSASLIEMVCNLTIDKKAYIAVQKRIHEYKKASSQIGARLAKLADEDVRAFDAVIKAYRSKDKSKIKKSLKYAIEVPMEVRKLSQRLEEIGYKVSKIGNKNAVSDAKTAVYLARAASKSALENVVINKKALAALDKS